MSLGALEHSNRRGIDLFKSGTDVWGRERIDGCMEWVYLPSVFQAPDALHRARTTYCGCGPPGCMARSRSSTIALPISHR